LLTPTFKKQTALVEGKVNFYGQNAGHKMIVAGHKQMWWIEDAHPMFVNSTTATNFQLTHSVSQLDLSLVNHQAQATDLERSQNQISGGLKCNQCY